MTSISGTNATTNASVSMERFGEYRSVDVTPGSPMRNVARKNLHATFCLNPQLIGLQTGQFDQRASHCPVRGAMLRHTCSSPGTCVLVNPQNVGTLRRKRRKSGKRGAKPGTKRETRVGTTERAAIGPSKMAPPTQNPRCSNYVRHMTRAADERRSLDCQGLHNASVLPYGSSRTVR
jgi:hypothetical protein